MPTKSLLSQKSAMSSTEMTGTERIIDKSGKATAAKTGKSAHSTPKAKPETTTRESDKKQRRAVAFNASKKGRERSSSPTLRATADGSGKMRGLDNRSATQCQMRRRQKSDAQKAKNFFNSKIRRRGACRRLKSVQSRGRQKGFFRCRSVRLWLF